MSRSGVPDGPFQRRAGARYKLQLPVIFHWNDGIEHTSAGFTSDVAMEGALILSRECPPVGSAVRLEVLLPSPEGDNQELRINCSGTVVHTCAKSGVSAFGFCGTFKDEELTFNALQVESDC